MWGSLGPETTGKCNGSLQGGKQPLALHVALAEARVEEKGRSESGRQA